MELHPAGQHVAVGGHKLWVEREGSATSIFGDRIALVGGRDREERNQTSCDLYDPAHNTWSACSNLHLGRSEFGQRATLAHTGRSKDRP